MPVFPASSVSGGLVFLSRSVTADAAASQNAAMSYLNFPCSLSHNPHCNRSSVFFNASKVSVSDGSGSSTANGLDQPSIFSDDVRQARRSADWKAAREYHETGALYEGRVEGFNGGGLLVKFYSLVGFLPFPQLSPLHSCKAPGKAIQEIGVSLVGSMISVKVIRADEDNRKLIFSEKESDWLKFSPQLNVGDIFEGLVGSVEDYGAFVHLRFPDGLHHITGLVHVSEVSWDLVQDVRDVLSVGDQVRVKIVNIDREKSRITLSIRQLEEDPLLETLDKVIPQESSNESELDGGGDLEPVAGLGIIIEELLKEDGIHDVRIRREGLEKRVVSQDLQLWVSNVRSKTEAEAEADNASNNGIEYTLLARAGRQVQEIQLTTSLDQQGIKAALQRALQRVP